MANNAGVASVAMSQVSQGYLSENHSAKAGKNTGSFPIIYINNLTEKTRPVGTNAHEGKTRFQM